MRGKEYRGGWYGKKNDGLLEENRGRKGNVIIEAISAWEKSLLFRHIVEMKMTRYGKESS